MASHCAGKFMWPELVGSNGNVAVATIEKQNPGVTAEVLMEGTVVTEDFKCDRVRVFVNAHGKITQSTSNWLGTKERNSD